MTQPTEQDDYAYPVDQCSVEDQVALIAFRQKRQEWLSWLNIDEHHAIWKQITAMAWNDVVFRILNEARSPAEDQPVSATNGMLGSFIDQGYVSTQVLAIRRLVDKRTDVISLRRLVRSIRDYRPHFTRELFVSYDGLPYEWEPIRDRWFARIAETGETLSSLPTTGPQAFDMARRQHEAFDWLSDTPADRRSRSDVMSEWVFDRLDAALDDDAIKQIVALSHKFLAHAADHPSRSAASLDEFGLTLEMVASAHKAIILVAQAVSVLFVDGRNHLGIVPTSQYNQFEGLDRPYISPTDIRRLRQTWHSCSRAREDWCQQWQSVFRKEAEGADGEKPSAPTGP